LWRSRTSRRRDDVCSLCELHRQRPKLVDHNPESHRFAPRISYAVRQRSAAAARSAAEVRHIGTSQCTTNVSSPTTSPLISSSLPHLTSALIIVPLLEHASTSLYSATEACIASRASECPSDHVPTSRMADLRRHSRSAACSALSQDFTLWLIRIQHGWFAALIRSVHPPELHAGLVASCLSAAWAAPVHRRASMLLS
jgi:hypothetical protein